MKSVALVVLVLGLAPQAWAAPVVTSDSDCPAAAEVSVQLANLWRGDRPTAGAAHIRLNGAQLMIDLAGENEPVATRSLPMESDCRSRVQTAALVIAAWLDTVSADPVGLSAPVPPVPSQTQTPGRPSARLLLGAGGFASMDSRGPGAMLAVEAEGRRLLGRLGWQVGLSFPLPRSMAVGQGDSRWWRPVLDLMIVLPLHEGPWNVAASAGPALGLLVVSGTGFDQNHSDAVLSWGALAGLRLAHTRLSGSAVWAELRGLLWPGAQSIRNDVVGATGREAALPRVEAHLGVGFSFAAL